MSFSVIRNVIRGIRSIGKTSDKLAIRRRRLSLGIGVVLLIICVVSIPISSSVDRRLYKLFNQFASIKSSIKTANIDRGPNPTVIYRIAKH